VRGPGAAAVLAALALVGPASAAPDGSQVTFAVKGDWGAGTAAQWAVTRRMCSEHARDPFAFVLTTGDNFYGPDGAATNKNFYGPEACLLRAGVKWRAAWGNHDVRGASTRTVLGAPRYYSFAQGPLRVIVLDANEPTLAAQMRFLRTTLGAATESAVVVAFHQPIFTAGFHGPETAARRAWEPLFRRYKVDLVLQGHNHHYERITRGGVNYVTSGGGGQRLYPCVRPADGLKRCTPAHHFLRITVNRTTIQVTAIEPSGKTLAVFAL
jgi:acid phosphatase